MSPHATEIVHDFLREVWNDGDEAAVDRYLASRYTLHHDPGDPWHGRSLTVDEYRERLRVSRAPFPDQRFELVELFADGSAVIATWTWNGTHLGDLPGFPATGKRIAMSGITVYYFDGDRLSGHWQIVDRLGVFQQLTAPA